MSKMKGFTLIELLAVIVIIGIISLIATPIVSNTIKSIEKDKFKRNALGILKAIKLERENKNQIGNNESDRYEIYSSNNTLVFNGDVVEYSFDGVIDGDGYAYIDLDGKTSIIYSNSKWCVYKRLTDITVTLVDGTCNNVSGTLCAEDDLDITISPENNTWSQSKSILILGDSLKCKKIFYKAFDFDYQPYENIFSIDTNAEISIKTESTAYVTQEFSINVTNIDKTAPTDVSYTCSKNGNSITINATATDADSGIYGFEFSVNDGSTWSEMQTTGSVSTSAVSKSYTFNDLDSNGDYVVKVRATNNAWHNTPDADKINNLGQTESTVVNACTS